MLNKLFPFLTWIHELKDPQILRADLLAGLTVALVLIPQSMAYATLAGLPEVYGLYIAFVPVFIAALWGSSRQLGTGPVAVVSTMTATILTPVVISMLAPDHTQEEFMALFIPTAMLLTLMVGIFQFSLGLFRLGAIVNFLSHPVIVGFTNAAALFIGLTQISKVFGVDMPGGASDNFLTVRIWGVIQNLDQTHIPTLIMGVATFAILIGMKRYFPRYPGVLFAVVGTTLTSYILDFEGMGGKVVGTIPEGLPGFQMPAFSYDAFTSLMLGAVIISLVGFMEAISIAKAMAAKTKDRVDPNQELVGQGLGNIAGSFFQSYPASGSFSRSAVNLNAGAKTGFSSVVTAALVLITLLFLTPLLYHLPKATLAAVVIMAVFGLINVKAIKHIWLTSKHDGVAAIVTFFATIASAPQLDHGIMVGASLAIGLYLYRTMQPRVALLGRYKDGTLRDLSVHKDLPMDNNIIAVRFDGSLYFANVSYFEDAMLKAVADHPTAKYLLVVGDAINQIDASGEEVLHHLVERLADSNVTVVFSGLKRQILQVLRATGLNNIIGEQHIFPNEDMAFDAIYDMLGQSASGKYCALKKSDQLI
ncbi:MAG: sodium-independent anion transporter [endosymbiont of Galathealinum brachiosum]|uniref:Sodium-independent anion transporter n=1 Tax=endosymbiont of Galathealinum brachiosum TaxID=2200906 RepID=A0A370D6T0_9GAMM|nr:MAG: sodium-independent anion transporter [endosymbiont of Galathealinum brachiosum]